ncbi:alpha/beta hydrolase [Mucilaginibacter angelicae]|uniref:Alpha/beta hydrolase n=2 Tax=Mucilaginibacter angelicae TaxID=869718 RepID=A0ABV6L1H0_9SPHI
MNDFTRIVAYSNDGISLVTELKLAPDGLPAFNLKIYDADPPSLKPVLVYFHGGNWISGSLKTCDSICTTLAEGSGYTVISVDYALAPEHHFPVPLYQGLAVLNWIKKQGCYFGIDKEKIVVGGDNAGGNIAAGLVHLINQTREYKLLGQLLVCPALHYQFDTPSYNIYEKGYFISKELMKLCWATYLGNPGEAFNESASPLLVFDVDHVPPTLIYTAEHDPLRYEAELYAAVLQEQGIKLSFQRFKGTTHYFWQMDAILDTARKAHQEAIKWLISVNKQNS